MQFYAGSRTTNPAGPLAQVNIAQARNCGPLASSRRFVSIILSPRRNPATQQVGH
jgi:hypothetical protein